MWQWMTRLCVLALFLLAGCQSTRDKNILLVGAMAGPEADLVKVAAEEAMKRYHLQVKVVTFSDYNIPNMALADNDIDINIYQHMPFLKAQMKARGYQFAVLGRSFIFPMSLYSKKVLSLSTIPKGAQVAIPNDPTNEGRALILLQKVGLLKLHRGVGFAATPMDIVKNKRQLKIVLLDAAQLPRALGDVDLAAINTTYALPAGLKPEKDALFSESIDSAYVNLLVCRAGDKNKVPYQQFLRAYQSAAVVAKARALYGRSAIAAWVKS